MKVWKQKLQVVSVIVGILAIFAVFLMFSCGCDRPAVPAANDTVRSETLPSKHYLGPGMNGGRDVLSELETKLSDIMSERTVQLSGGALRDETAGTCAQYKRWRALVMLRMEYDFCGITSPDFPAKLEEADRRLRRKVADSAYAKMEEKASLRCEYALDFSSFLHDVVDAMEIIQEESAFVLFDAVVVEAACRRELRAEIQGKLRELGKNPSEEEKKPLALYIERVISEWGFAPEELGVPRGFIDRLVL